MAHPQQHFFVGAIKQLMPDFFSGKKVVEIGSLNLNGTVRVFFSDCDYLGIDVGAGNDVDLVCYGEDYGGQADSSDVLISCEAMEHNPAWKKTWLNMLRLVRTNGLVVMTCATIGRRQHGTDEFMPTDSPLTTGKGQNYYQNLVTTDFTAIVNHDAWFSVWAFFQDHTSHDLYFFGVGHSANEAIQNQAKQLREALDNHYHRVNILGIQ